jgi:hypothetical protein
MTEIAAFDLARYGEQLRPSVKRVSFAIPFRDIEEMSAEEHGRFVAAVNRMIEEAVIHGLTVERWADPMRECEMFMIRLNEGNHANA